jgi:dTDP-4-amino-4,6-dideoxygalactose transaminase
VKLRALEEWNDRRRRIAATYLEALADTRLVLPFVPDAVEPAWHLFVVRSEDRDGLAARLREEGIQTLIHYPIPPHRQAAYASLHLPEGRFPISEAMHREVLSLPIGPHMADDDVAYVADTVRRLTR